MRKLTLALALLLSASRLYAADWYAAPSGSGATCSSGSPCSLTTLLCPSGTCAYGYVAGDNLYLKAGTYTNPSPGSGAPAWTSGVIGTVSAQTTVAPDPVTADPYTNPWAAKIDGGNCGTYGPAIIHVKSSYVTYRNLDIYSSYAETNVGGGHGRESLYTSSNPTDIKRGEDFTIDQTGVAGAHPGNKFIGNRLHDGKQGIGFWKECAPCEFSENYVYNNGWDGPPGDRPHGHGTYIQHDTGARATIRGNLYYYGFSHGGHQYGSGAAVLKNVDWQDNTFFRNGYGTIVFPGDSRNLLLGGDATVFNTTVTNCLAYYSGAGTGWKMGYGGGTNGTTITGNSIYDSTNMQGTQTALTYTGNTVCNGSTANCGGGISGYTTGAYPANTYPTTKPGADTVLVLPSYYQPRFCSISAINWDDNSTIVADLSLCGYTNGDTYAIYNAYNFDGGAWATGTYNSASPNVTITVTGITPPQPLQYQGVSGIARDRIFRVVDTAGTVATPTNTPTNTSTPTRTPTPTSTPTYTPSVTPSFSPTPSYTPLPGTATFTPSQTPTVTPTPAASTSFGVNQCSVSAPMTKTADPFAISGFYASSPTANSGKLTCVFSIPYEADWRVWINKLGADGNNDSYYVDIDGINPAACTTDTDATCTHIFDVSESLQPCTGPDSCNYTLSYDGAGTYSWQILSDRAGTCGACTANKGVEYRPHLTAGAHTLTLRAREAATASARLDYFILTTDLSYIPALQGGPTPTPTPGAGSKHSHRCNGKIGWHSHPNSGPHRHVPCPWK